MALTPSDISKLISAMEKTFVTQSHFKDELSKLKDGIFDHVDPVMKELLILREEQTLLSYHASKHSDQLDALEKIHPKGRHLPV